MFLSHSSSSCGFSRPVVLTQTQAGSPQALPLHLTPFPGHTQGEQLPLSHRGAISSPVSTSHHWYPKLPSNRFSDLCIIHLHRSLSKMTSGIHCLQRPLLRTAFCTCFALDQVWDFFPFPPQKCLQGVVLPPSSQLGKACSEILTKQGRHLYY